MLIIARSLARRNTTTEYKGVWGGKRTGRCFAQIRSHGERIYLGSFDTTIKAARAYDRKAVEFFGEFAHLNFPQEWEGRIRKAQEEGRKIKDGGQRTEDREQKTQDTEQPQ
jgi:hypothetical protein